MPLSFHWHGRTGVRSAPCQWQLLPLLALTAVGLVVILESEARVKLPHQPERNTMSATATPTLPLSISRQLRMQQALLQQSYDHVGRQLTQLSRPYQPSRLALLTVTAIATKNPHEHLLYWASVGSKQAYASFHGYPMYVLSDNLSPRPPAWGKFLAMQMVLQHSGADWVWCTDSDAFIMNPSAPIEPIIDEALFNNPEASVIVAKDCHHINSGSILVRGSAWGRQHLADAWFLNETQKVKGLTGVFEQRALQYLYKKVEGVDKHYHIVPQTLINSYPSGADGWRTCTDGSGSYKDGDLVVHFPGKKIRRSYFTAENLMHWLNLVPLNADNKPEGNERSPKRAVVYQITATDSEAARVVDDASNSGAVSLSAMLQVNMTSSIHGITHTEVFALAVKSKPDSMKNPGWPVQPPKLLQQFAQALV